MKINFKLLATFLAVAEHSSFRKAAEQMFLSMPAVSMQIKQLEEQLGVALFQRTTRKVELTREGEQLMISARKAVAELESGLAGIQQTADVQHGHLSFGCVPTVAGSLLPRVLLEFAKKYPGITVNVRELSHRELVEAVRRREVDFGIGPIPEKKGELEFAPVFVDEYMALLPKAHETSAGKAGMTANTKLGTSTAVRSSDSITLRELSKLPLLTLWTSTLFREHMDAALQSSGLQPQRNYEFTHVSTLVAMAEAGLGVAVLPGVAVPAKTKLRAMRITSPALTRTVGIVTIRGHSLSPAAARLVELCQRQMAPARKRA